jgi:hypothetical protein
MLQVVQLRSMMRSERVTSGGLSYNIPVARGRCVPAVFLNKMRLEPRELEDVDPATLEGAEIYRGFEEVPVEYAMQAGDCGAILMWTSFRPNPYAVKRGWKQLLVVIAAVAGMATGKHLLQ